MSSAEPSATGSSSSTQNGSTKPKPPLRAIPPWLAPLRFMGVPQSVLRWQPRLPSRNWSIFLSLSISLTSLYIYDRSECKKIKGRQNNSLGAQSYFRKLTYELSSILPSTLSRLLPMLAGHLIMIMLWQEGTLSVSDYTPFIRQEGLGHSKVAMERLERLWIITQKNGKLSMSSTFREGLRRALTGGGDHRSFGVPSNTTSNQITISTLDDYAKSRWESILHYMVGSSGSSIPSKTVLNLLLKSQLMQKVPSSRNEYNITSKGFQFLLEDVNTQLWSLLLQYLSDSEELGGGGGDLVEVLNFLFLLGSLELGREYSTEDLTRTQIRMLKDFKEFGLIYQDESDENGEEKNGFYPTRLAVTLTSNENPIKEDREINEDDGFLILETNYRLYAYTGSNLRIAVLNLFCSLKKRFQNLVIGNITRESVKRALANGITAEQIIAYLTHHAHPQMSKNDPLLPVTCTDQIRLWEREKHRVTTEAGALFTDFESSGDYQMVRKYAQESGYLIWENEEQRRFFVTEDGRPQIGEFIRRRMS